jgi:hypothetical protein
VKKKNTEYDVNLKKIVHIWWALRTKFHSFIVRKRLVYYGGFQLSVCVNYLERIGETLHFPQSTYICNNLYWFNFCGMYLEIFGGKKSL